MKSYRVSENAPISLMERVYAELRKTLITGKIDEGTRIVESTVAQKLGVSRTPVREALRKLSSEGLLISIPKVGYMIAEMSNRDMEDLWRTRSAIEQIAGRWAVEGVTERELERLRQNLETTSEVLESGQTKKMIDLDIEFHGIIYRASRSKTLCQITQSLSDRTLKYRMACIPLPEIARRAREGHDEIYCAMKSRNSERVEAAIFAHLEVSKRDILDYLKQVRQEAFVGNNSSWISSFS